MQSIISTAPDGKHSAVLEYTGEIRFGPTFYTLTVDEIPFGKRVFGNKFLWSPDSRHFAIQEWETTRETHGPQTRLLLIDVEARRECVLSQAEQGFIVPGKFENDKLIYTKEYHGPDVIREFEIEFLSLNRWKNLSTSLMEKNDLHQCLPAWRHS